MVSMNSYIKIIKIYDNMTQEERMYNNMSIIEYIFKNSNKETRSFYINELCKLEREMLERGD